MSELFQKNLNFFSKKSNKNVYKKSLTRKKDSKFINGCLVKIKGFGVLIQGKAGIGKSILVMELIESGHFFIGDDLIEVIKVNNEIYGCAIEHKLKHHLFIRELGIFDIKKIYKDICLEDCKIDLIIEIFKNDNFMEYEFSYAENKFIYDEIFDIKIKKYKFNISNKKNLKIMTEWAVMLNSKTL